MAKFDKPITSDLRKLLEDRRALSPTRQDCSLADLEHSAFRLRLSLDTEFPSPEDPQDRATRERLHSFFLKKGVKFVFAAVPWNDPRIFEDLLNLRFLPGEIEVTGMTSRSKKTRVTLEATFPVDPSGRLCLTGSGTVTVCGDKDSITLGDLIEVPEWPDDLARSVRLSLARLSDYYLGDTLPVEGVLKVK